MATIFDNKNVKIVLGIAGVISLLLLLNKLFGKHETDEEIASKKSRKDSYKNVPPSFPEYKYGDMADSLENALATDLTENEEAVYGVFRELKNISDVNKLIDHYGKRRVATSIGGRSLPQTITALFSASEKARLNAILKTKGINYRFK
jgi:hypothetical protein